MNTLQTLNAQILNAKVSDRLALLETLTNSLMADDAVTDTAVSGPRGHWTSRTAEDDLATILNETIPCIRLGMERAEEQSGTAFRDRYLSQHRQTLNDVA